jgi:hypothetical protein
MQENNENNKQNTYTECRKIFIVKKKWFSKVEDM